MTCMRALSERQGRGSRARRLTAPVIPPAQLLWEQEAEPALRCRAAPSCQSSCQSHAQTDSPVVHSTQGSTVRPHPAFSLKTLPPYISKAPRAGSLWKEGCPTQRCVLPCPGWTTVRRPRGRGQDQTLPSPAAVPFPKQVVNT